LFISLNFVALAQMRPALHLSGMERKMNELTPIRITPSKGRTGRCDPSSAVTRSPIEVIRTLQAELAHVRQELRDLRYATQQLVRQVL
jgi:hypothetical protein